MSLKVDLGGTVIELIDLGRLEHAAEENGRRLPIRLRGTHRRRVLLNCQDDTQGYVAEGLTVAIPSFVGNGLGFLAYAMSVAPRREGDAVVYEHRGWPTPGWTPPVLPEHDWPSLRMTVALREGVVEIDLYQEWRDDSAW